MNAKKYNDIKKLLIHKRASLVKSEKNTDQDIQENMDGWHGDSADMAGSSQEQEKALFLKTRMHDELRHIDEALERMEKGDYGVCAECDEEISKKRLEVLPYSIYCVERQEKIESDKSLSHG